MMDSGARKLSFGIRKASPADLLSIQKEKALFHIPDPGKLRLRREAHYQTTFVAFDKQRILGFTTVFIDPMGKGIVVHHYTRKGFERKGIGNRLLGKAHAFFLRNGVKESSLRSTLEAREYYLKRTPYARAGKHSELHLVAALKRTPGKKRRA